MLCTLDPLCDTPLIQFKVNPKTVTHNFLDNNVQFGEDLLVSFNITSETYKECAELNSFKDELEADNTMRHIEAEVVSVLDVGFTVNVKAVWKYSFLQLYNVVMFRCPHTFGCLVSTFCVFLFCPY